ncbi:MAG: hypothetical protein ACREQ9_08080, partial [Candidatus Binatia bacterium]
MSKKMRPWCVAAIASLASSLAVAPPAWSRRMVDAQNTGNAGAIGTLTPQTVGDLKMVHVFPVGQGNATPVASGDLVIFGAWNGFFHVMDLPTRKVLIRHNAFAAGPGEHGAKIDVTAVLGTVTVPVPGGDPREEERAYLAAFGDANRRGLYCLNLDRIRADLTALRGNAAPVNGSAYFCEGAAWPLEIMGPNQQNANQDGTGLFSRDQPILVGGVEEIRDVLYQPS